MTNTASISVIVPIYNSEQYLQRCIESILNQTHQNIELLLINDGSTDNSLNICHEYEEKDKRVVLINKQNGGVSSARNCGLDITSGEFVTFVDSDDYIALNMYERMMDLLIEHDADIVECGRVNVSSDSSLEYKRLKKKIVVGKDQCLASYAMLKNTTLSNCDKIYRRSIVSEVRYSQYRYLEDHLFNIKAFSACTSKITTSNCYYYYCNNDNESTSRKEKIIKDNDEILSALTEAVNTYRRIKPKLVKYAALWLCINCISQHRRYNKCINENSIIEYRNKLKNVFFLSFKDVGLFFPFFLSKKILKNYIKVLLFRFNIK